MSFKSNFAVSMNSGKNERTVMKGEAMETKEPKKIDIYLMSHNCTIRKP